MSKKSILLMLLVLAVVSTSTHADELTGMADVTAVDGEILSFRHEGTEYIVADEDVVSAFGSIKGRVVDEQGGPVANATIRLGGTEAQGGNCKQQGEEFFHRLNICGFIR